MGKTFRSTDPRIVEADHKRMEYALRRMQRGVARSRDTVQRIIGRKDAALIRACKGLD